MESAMFLALPIPRFWLMVAGIWYTAWWSLPDLSERGEEKD